MKNFGVGVLRTETFFPAEELLRGAFYGTDSLVSSERALSFPRASTAEIEYQ